MDLGSLYRRGKLVNALKSASRRKRREITVYAFVGSIFRAD